jgi:hypothetical protein
VNVVSVVMKDNNGNVVSQGSMPRQTVSQRVGIVLNGLAVSKLESDLINGKTFIYKDGEYTIEVSRY